MTDYKFDAPRWLRSNAKAHHARKDFDTSSTMRTIAEEIDILRAKLAALKAAARPVVEWWNEMDDEGKAHVCTAQDFARFDALARLVGEK